MRYEREVAWRFVGNENLAQRYKATARLLYGRMQSWNETAYLVRRFRLPDGTLITCAHMGDMPPMLAIDVRDTDQPFYSRLVSELWIPEGFVLHPVTDNVGRGWGLPVVQEYDAEYASDEQIFAPSNMRPGLDVSRWTEGGVLGQVIVTQRINNGYPNQTPEDAGIVITPFYHGEFGPKPTEKYVPEYSDWSAYRIEFQPISAQKALPPVEKADLRDYKKELFKQVNAHRQSLSLVPFTLLPRGFFNVGQAHADMAERYLMMGHMVAEYPSTYKTSAERSAKNGWGGGAYFATSATAAENVAFMGADILVLYAGEVEYTDANGRNVYSFTPNDAYIPPSTALSSWLASTAGHKEIVELEHDGYVSFDVGAVNGATVGQITTPWTQWIQCGNKQWTSPEPEVPVVSWNGFPHENLQFETWRVRFSTRRYGTDPDYTYGTGVTLFYPMLKDDTQPLIPSGTMSVKKTLLEYFTSADESIVSLHAPLGTEIYMRGRAIAVAPNSGFVLAAAIKKFGSNAAAYYRLYAICLHADDQDSDRIAEGETRYVRLWYSDIMADDPVLRTGEGVVSLPCHPKTVIRKVYGHERDTHPGATYVEQFAENTWRGGTLIDVGVSGLHGYVDLKKYDSMWKFNESCTKAICLRSSFNADLFEDNEFGSTDGTWAGVMLDDYLTHSGAAECTNYAYPTSVGTTPNRLYSVMEGRPVFCEIDLQFETCSFTPFDEYGTVLPTYHTEDPITETPTYFRPVVAYYDGDVPKALYRVTYNQFKQFSIPPHGTGSTYLLGEGYAGTFFIGYARGSLTAPTEPATLYSHEVSFDNEHILAFNAPVFHVSAEHVFFGASGIAPAWTSASFDPTVTRSTSSVTKIQCEENPEWHFWCDVTETERPLNKFALWLDGERVAYWSLSNEGKHYAHPAMSTNAHIVSSMLGTWWEGYPRSIDLLAPLNECAGFYGGFGVDKNGEWVATASVVVQPNGFLYRYRDTSPVDPGFEWAAPCSGGGLSGYAYHLNFRMASFAQNGGYAEFRGGTMRASFASQEGLADLMNIPGSNPRSTDVRVV